jgi:serine/threonine protein kinase/Flp pilus assembly protein TadD
MNDSLSASVRLRLEKICTRFEAAWQAAGLDGAPPRIDDYVGGVEQPERQALLWELLLLDLHYRRRRGECPDPADYSAHFPDDNDLIRADLAAAKPTGFGSRPPTTLPGPVPIEPAASATQEAAADQTCPTIPGYRVLGELGKGGMGEVLRGHDLHLGRDLAVKVLLKKYQGEPHLVQRFLAEARIHARLQHPGIVPLHEVGELPDRRPYFTMKLVEGRTLAGLLKERADPGRELPRFLGIFEQVCQAMAYAHSQEVIHRDLKPANVMVGAFGEVQVMDWGLAKALDRSGPVDAAAAKPADNGEAWETQPGAVMGTYAYMAPEQARGEVDSLDERCDVFGLGGILCEILTGHPPFTGADRDELAARARACDHAEAHAALDTHGADAELVQLVKECLAAAPSRRPADARALAAAMTAYLAEVQERLRRAELERTAAEARAQEAKATAAAERKARRRTKALAAMVLALVAVGASGALLVQDQRGKRREDQARHDGEQRQQVESALDKATAMRQQQRFREAAAMLAQGWKALGDGGPDDLRQRLNVAETALALVKRLDTIRQRRATWVRGHFDERTAARDYAAEFRQAGLGEVGDDEEAVAARVRASGVAGPLVAALDDWVFAAPEPESKLWVLGVARKADPDPWRDNFRDPAVWRDRQAIRALAEEALRDGGAKLGEMSPQLLELLGRLLGSGAEAVPLLRAAQRRYPNDFWLNLDLGSALRQAKQYGEEGYNRVAVALRPDAAAAHNNLGSALHDKKDLEAAIAEFHKAIELDPELANAHHNLGVALKDQMDREGAIAEFHKAMELDPKNAKYHIGLGGALYDKGDLEGGIAEFHKAIELDPENFEAHFDVGVALAHQKDWEGAISAYKKAIESDPNHALSHLNLGNALAEKKDLNGAAREFHKAIALDPELAIAHTNLGVVLAAKGDLVGAIAACQKAIGCDPKFAPAHHGLANCLRDKGQLDEAIRAYKKAIEFDPNLAHAHYNFAICLRNKGQLDEAIQQYRMAIDLDPKHALAHGALGEALSQLGRFTEAREATRRALDLLQPSDPLRHLATRQLQQCEQFLTRDRKLAAILEGSEAPANDAERLALAQLCQQPFKKRYAASARFYAEAFAHDPKLSDNMRQQHRYNAACAAVQAGCGQGEDASNLPEKAQRLLRVQALRWLHDDLAACAKLADREDPSAKQMVRQNLAHWQQDSDLARVRDKESLDRLADDERKEWRRLWDDVAALLKKVEEKK